MHQTFYIDIDEEISSVIDRLRKSMALDNFFVVPKRALFLQSIVNLKLLKREADKVNKRVILVTQDEIGASMAGRAGVDVQGSLDGMDLALDEEIDLQNVSKKHKSKNNVSSEDSHIKIDNKKVRLNAVGSSDFYEEPGSKKQHVSKPITPKVQARKNITSSTMEQRVSIKEPMNH